MLGGGVGTRGMGARRDEGKLAMFLVTADTAKGGSGGSVRYSRYCCV